MQAAVQTRNPKDSSGICFSREDKPELHFAYGRDGKDTMSNANRLVGADALSYSLHYYDGDYAAISGTGTYNAGYHVSGYGGSLVDLWNGNIAGMVTTLQDIPTHAAQPQGAQYRYDQLNRIKEMQVWQNMDVVNNQWQSSSALADYRTSYRYDANGNILNLNRNGHNSVNLAMDSLSYHYIAGTNRLAYVDDAVASGNYSVDIDDQSVGNYAYDATGNLIKDVAEEIDSIVWTAYGKVLRVVRSSVSSKPDLHFAYGPDGNRLSKKAVYGNDSTIWTFYVRDAQGNTMATYKHKESSGVLHLTDHVMYGSSRLGSHERKHVELLGAGSSPITARAGIYGLERGDKRYELSNHLGNVLAVVSDRRAKASCADTLVSGYWSDVISTNDYYPFGMGMVERGDDGSYRYGFNGMQRDDEWQGAGNAYDFGARMYDGRLGRWMSVDALFRDFPQISPYTAFANTPILIRDKDGNDLEIRIVTDANGNKTLFITMNAVIIDLRTKGQASDASGLQSQGVSKARTTFSQTYFSGFTNPDGSKEKVKVVFTLKAEVIYDVSKIRRDDHVIAIVDDIPALASDPPGTGDPIGRASIGGNIIMVENPRDIQTKIHEIGHSLGLGHVEDTPDNKSNLMKEKGSSGYSLTPSQLKQMFNSYLGLADLVGGKEGKERFRNASRKAIGSGDSKAELKSSLKTWRIKYDKEKAQ